MKYYTYIHKRKDSQEIFYVGIGTQRTKSTQAKYQRARTFSKRNFLWKRIVTKCKGFDWEIVFESNNEQEVKAKEIELIKLYGRMDLKTGILSNLTDGGDGRLNGESSTYDTNKKNLDKYRESRKRKCYQYSLDGSFIKKWNSITEASNFLNLSNNSGIIQCLQGKIRQAYGFIWRYSLEETQIMQKTKFVSKEIHQFNKEGVLLNSYKSLSDAAKFTNGSLKSISLCALNKTKSSGGFVWKYN